MAFVVEDGTGLATATSYVSVADAITYHADRGNTSWALALTAAQEIALIRATQAVDARGLGRFIGSRLTAEQGLEWPRTDAVDINGFEIDEDEIPSAVKKAVCEGALVELGSQGSLQPSSDRGGMITRERVEGAVDISYLPGAPTGTTYSAYLEALNPVLSSSGIKVVRV
jgi:hypothetical protein